MTKYKPIKEDLVTHTKIAGVFVVKDVYVNSIILRRLGKSNWRLVAMANIKPIIGHNGLSATYNKLKTKGRLNENIS